MTELNNDEISSVRGAGPIYDACKWVGKKVAGAVEDAVSALDDYFEGR